MKNKITKLGLLLLLTVAMVACVSATSITKIAGDSWKEEIELHDGSTMIIKRTQHYKGRHEIGQAVPVGEHTVSFTLPQTGKSYTWTSEYGEELGRTNFNLLAVHVLDNTPYIVTEPNGCLSYNKWGRPNPPYVIFKYVDNAWQHIQMSELPPEFNTLNVLMNIKDEDTRGISSMRTISAVTIKVRNAELRQPELKSLVREPIKVGCGELIHDGKGGWYGVGWFKDNPSLETCVSYCNRQKITAEYCPCNRFFKGN
jgi:uncharacterized protein involved in tolerance to divalent cations